MKYNKEFDRRNFIAKRTDTGFTWTLASRLGQMLAEAETLFGERDKSFTILGIEFGEEIPRLWYPYHGKYIVIQLDMEALNSSTQACFQLAHETIHLLSPNGGEPTTVLEEGLAVYFSQIYMEKYFQQPTWNARHASYIDAVQAFRRLIALNPNVIKEIREQEPFIGNIAPEMLKSTCPDIDQETIAALCRPFLR